MAQIIGYIRLTRNRVTTDYWRVLIDGPNSRNIIDVAIVIKNIIDYFRTRSTRFRIEYNARVRSVYDRVRFR